MTPVALPLSVAARYSGWWVGFLTVCLAAVSGPAQVYNLHLVTDNVPDYTDLRSLVESATDAWQSPADKCIAVWRWGRRSRRQTSCAVDAGRTIWDPVRHYNSYGAMNCGIISSLNIAAWLQLGYRARYVQLGDHTVSEVSWDDAKTWHMFDSSMSVFCYNHAGEVASCEEIKAAHGCALSGSKVEPGHYYLYHAAPPCASHPGPTGWRCASDNPVEYNRTLGEGASSYTDGFDVDRYCQYARSGHRLVLNLRPGETYTRYWKPLDAAPGNGATRAHDPDYFRPLADGSDPDAQHGLNNLRGNGQWSFEPNLADPHCTNLFYDSDGITAGDGEAPNLHPNRSGRVAWVVFQLSAANVITSLRLEAEGQRRSPTDMLRVLVSRDAGTRWQSAWESAQPGPQTIRLRVREPVAGGSQCWIKIEMRAANEARAVGVDAIRVTTITQLNRRTLPTLTLGGNEVLLRADAQVETVELWPPLHAGAYRQTAAEEDTVFSDSLPDGMYKATLGAGTNGKPGSVTWRLAVPSEITSVDYHVVRTVRTPRSWVSLRHAWDEGPFQEFDRSAGDAFPFDRQVSRRFAGGEVATAARHAALRAVFFCDAGAATYNMPGIQDVLIRVQHKPRTTVFQPIEVTYNWTEHRDGGEVIRSHSEFVTKLPHRYTINVAGKRDPTMNWVRMNLAGYSPNARSARAGYSDGIDVGAGYEQPRVAHRWGNMLSRGKPYTVSRGSSTGSGNADTEGRELTDGVVIAPTDHVRSKAVQPATAFWDPGEPVSVVVDLGTAQDVGGVRVTTHQPNAAFCHPASIEVTVSTDGQSWHAAGVIRHDDLWRPPGDYEPWEHDDDPDYAGLPAGGRLAYSYPLGFSQTAPARFVRFVCAPQPGKGMGLSEFQIFDRVTTVPWPAEIRLPGD